MEKYTDETVLNFGKHKGKKLANVPAEWLIWYDENASNPNQQLLDYIADNKMALMQEADLNKIPRGR